MYTIDTSRPVVKSPNGLNALDLDTVIGNENGVFALKVGHDSWTICYPDDSYPSGYRQERFRSNRQLPPTTVFHTVAS